MSRAFKAEPHNSTYNYMNHTVQKGTSKRQIKIQNRINIVTQTSLLRQGVG